MLKQYYDKIVTNSIYKKVTKKEKQKKYVILIVEGLQKNSFEVLEFGGGNGVQKKYKRDEGRA